MAFIVYADLFGTALGSILIWLGGLGWAGRISAAPACPAGSIPSRRAGQAWLAMGIGTLTTISNDVIFGAQSTSALTVIGVTVMVGSLMIGIHAVRRPRK